jgi:glutathione S-transferase
MALTLIVGNKNYSSWSMRPYLALAHLDEPFEEVVVPLDQPDTAENIGRYSPAGRVPVLHDGELVIWDSLAILEYLAEKYPAAGLWPAHREVRARCRSISAEMHSGFAALREQMPMNITAHKPDHPVTPAVAKDIDRIRSIWRDCLAASGGPYLFGKFTNADCMYGPVVTRFRTYGVALTGPEHAYAETLWTSPEMQRWVAGAQAEKLRLARYE